MFTPILRSARDLERAVLKLAEQNVAIFRREGLRPLLKSGLRFQREKPGQNWFLNVNDILAAGRVADCEDIVAWALAELWLEEVLAWPILAYQGKGLFHVTLALCYGGQWIHWDPSVVLGM